MNKEQFDKENIFGIGNPNTAFAQYFVGNSYPNPLVDSAKSPMFLANVKHWHGAKKAEWFSHIAIEVPGEEGSTEWCEPVSDEEYNRL